MTRTLKVCEVTVYVPIPPSANARGRGFRVIEPHPCGEPVDRYNLCAKHAADRDRLTDPDEDEEVTE